VLKLEKAALESRLKKVATVSQPGAKSQTVSRPADLQRIQQLERERDDFLAQLEAANKKMMTSRGGDVNARVQQLTREVTNLRARVDVFEARAIPYTKEELALFTKPVAKPAALPEGKPSRNAGKEMPASTMALATKAQTHFEAKQYDKAEENYLEILKADDKSAYTHANLAAIQMEMGRLDEAEKHLKSALETSPDDAHATMLMGLLKFRQEKWDEAIDSLGRAGKLAPNNAEIQDNLGVALSQKGLRGPAEQAFRKAMVLNPNHAGVQSHLALFYALETPPNIPLARFHYQRAIAAGEPRNPDIEKMFDKKEAATK
jgi:tetratricopeptide (TPR) repeat protein